MDTPADGVKPKKSVALSGVVAGNTAISTVGTTGNDLHYRGYDILDIAERVRIRGDRVPAGARESLPNTAELARLQKPSSSCCARCRRRCSPCSNSCLPPAHPMDVLRTGCSMLGCCAPEPAVHRPTGARDLADRLLACFGSMLCYWHHFAVNRRRIEVQTDEDSIAGHFLHLLHGRKPPAHWVRAMHTSLNLYAEHEFNASTFTARVIAGTGSDLYSCITGAIGALRGPKHGGANEVAFEIQNRYRHAGCGRSGHQASRRRQGGHHRLRPPRLHDSRSAQSGDQGSRARAGARRRTTRADSRWPSASRAS